jgi:hypothetical protein
MRTDYTELLSPNVGEVEEIVVDGFITNGIGG